MFLTLFAFAVAILAIIRWRVLASLVRRLRAERDELLTTVTAQQRRIERLETPGTAGATGPAPAAAAPRGESEAPVARADLEAEGPAPSPADLPSCPQPPSEPESPPADWESFLGVKGAAWMGGIALLVSAISFARWAIEGGLVTPGMGFALMLISGIGALVSAEGLWRQGRERAASPLSSAGIAMLYVAFLAGHAWYGLISMALAFIAMVAVTATGGLLAVRYQAFATAVLTLLAGFATSIALTAGVEAAMGVLAYTLLLNLGTLAVAVKSRWFGLLGLGLAGTLILEIRWLRSFMSPENMSAGVAIALVFGIFYLVLPIAARDVNNRRVRRVSALGGLAPFLFALAFATSTRYLDQWPLLFGMIAVLDAAILIVAVLWRLGSLLRSAAILTTFTLAWWALQGLKADSGASLFGSTLFAILIVSIFGLARRIALVVGRADADELRVLESAALAAGAGLVLFGTIMVGYDRGAPVGPFLTIATTLVLILIEVSGHDGRLSGALALGTVGLAALTQIWFLSAVNAHTLIFYLAGPVVVSLLLSFLARRKAGETIDLEAEIAVQASGWISILGLFLALAQSDRTSTGWPAFLPLASVGWPLFLGLALQVVVVKASALRSNWTVELPALLGASAAYVWLWQRSYLTPDQHGMAFGVSVLFYLGFLLLPMIVPFAKWKDSPLPWFTAAMAGPAFFFPLRAVYRSAFGESAIGLLPLALVVLTVASLRAVARRFVAMVGDERGALLRLRHLTLFAVVAFWFIAMAIRLQLDRQWVALGWALEAVALCWLFGRLPHRGLPVLAGALYALVGARLLLNPAILEYEPRGLPIFNWILYTYALAGASCWLGQLFLRRASSERWIGYLAGAISLTGLLMGFWLVNLEILDYFSTGAYISLSGHSGYSVKLAFSVGWGVFAVVLLAAGVARRLRPLRYLSLAFMILTVAKVFLYDLAALGGFFQVFSFFGLAAGLLLVSFFYQRFVFRRSP
jgi:uncharacterized membrane protein